MSNLTNNTSGLRAILEAVNNLPEASSGGGEDLDSVISEQTALISQLSTTLDGKAAGGGGASVETKAVSFTGSSGRGKCFATGFVDGEIITIDQMGTGTNVTISETAVVGSIFAICGSWPSIALTNGQLLLTVTGSTSPYKYVHICQVT